MKKIGIHGSYFSRNFGDTLILHIIKTWVKEYSPSNEVCLPFVKSEKEALEILGQENKLRHIGDLDGLVFGPGGYFGEQPGGIVKKIWWTMRNYRRHIAWNKLLFKENIPYAIIGVGVGPISIAYMRRKIVKLFMNAKYASVRDKYSKEFLIQWGVPGDKILIAPDVALTLRSNNQQLAREYKKVALHFPNRNIEKSGKLDEFVQFIKAIMDDHKVYLLEDEEGQFTSDRTDNLKNIFKSYGIELPVIAYKDPEDLIHNLKNMDKIITSKLHVGIVGYSLGKRMLSIPLHSKTQRFYEQIGRDQYCVPLENIHSQLLLDKFRQLDSELNSDNILYNEAMSNKKLLFDFLGSLELKN